MDDTAQKAILTLTCVQKAMDELEVRGKQNHAIVVACMNDIERVVKMLNGKENEDGNTNPKS